MDRTPVDIGMLVDWLRSRVRSRGGVPTLFENSIASVVEQVREADGAVQESALNLLRDLLDDEYSLGSQPALENAADRIAKFKDTRAVPYSTYVRSQGVLEPLTWRGRSLLKNVWDMAIYSQIIERASFDLVVELGSGSGASACWLAELAGDPCRIVSFDRVAPDLEADRVEFREADIADDLADVVHAVTSPRTEPGRHRLVIDDAHVNLEGLFHEVVPVLQPGDVLLIEDSSGKQDELARLLGASTPDLMNWNALTDLFGRNCTSAMNSILVRSPSS